MPAAVAVGLILAVTLFFLLRWLIVDTEGVFLGRRVVVWLYDLTASRYDALKSFDADDEHYLVSRPLLEALGDRPAPRLLDVATGTGRVPYNLRRDGFGGSVVALDASRRMLRRAGAKLTGDERVNLCRGLAGALPFPGATFDAVVCLEALEFFPSEAVALAEMERVLRPGGLLVVTRRKGLEGRAFLHRYRSREALAASLEGLRLAAIRFERWQANYDLVVARKPAATRGEGLETPQV